MLFGLALFPTARADDISPIARGVGHVLTIAIVDDEVGGFRLLVHAERALDVHDILREWLGGVERPAKVRVVVDVDPYSFV